MTIAILGAGAFGTALAITLAQNEPVILWTRRRSQSEAMNSTRENAARLPGCGLPAAVSVTDDIATTGTADLILLALPLQQLRGFLTEFSTHLSGRTLVACCKGIEVSSGLGPVSIIQEVLPGSTAAILTGPSFAADIARGLPTALTLACKDLAAGKFLQQRLSTGTLRLYRSTDTIGAELGGALKNVIAIACGAVIGAGLGESARAALMTRGYAEMQRLALFFGADPATLAGLSGFGDLTLTCTSQQSRNFRLGLALGQRSEFDTSITVEGAATALGLHALAQRNGLDLPVTSAVAALLEKRLDVSEATALLLSRPLKEE